jgi:hypothetical protein
LLFDLAVKRGILSGPADQAGTVSFVRHVKPILERALGYRWVNRAAAFGYNNNGTGHGPNGTGDFSSHWAALADPSSTSRKLRASLAGRLRNCRWEETRGPMLKRLGWWPAQRPDDVYAQLDSADMVPWARGLGPDYQEMVDRWDRLGVVVDKGPRGSPFFVEQERDADVLGQ